MSTPFEAPVVAEYAPLPIDLPETSRLHEIVDASKRVAVRGVLALGLATGLVAAETVLIEPPAAVAETGGYPDANAPCVVGNPADPNSSYNKITGTGYWCSDYSFGYFTRNSQGQVTGNVQNSSRGYAFRNCTDWAAFRIPQLIQKNVPLLWGSGKMWDDKAIAAGYTVDNTPEPGDIAVWDGGNYGHVEVVESVNANGTVNTSGYNKKQNGVYGTQEGITADHYIDLNGTGKGINGEGISSGTPESQTNPYGPKNVTVVPNVLGGLSVFAANTVNTLSYKDQSYPGEDLKTKPWGTLPDHIKGQPEIVQYPNGAMSVFSHGDNEHLYHAWQTGPGTAWSGDISPWNVSLRGEPSTTFNFTGGVSVFFPDSNGEMREIDQIGQGGDLGTAPVHNLAGNLQGKPAVMNIDGALALFAHGADGKLYTKYQSAQGGSWSGWEILGNGQKIKGDPKVIINRLGGMTLLAIGEQGNIVGIDQAYKGESMNKPFYSLAKPAGVDFTGTPGIIQTANGEQMVFATSTGGTLYHKAQVGSSYYNWTDFFQLGGNFIGAPTVVKNSAGGVSVFGRNPDGTVITVDQPGYGASFNVDWVGVGKP